MASDFSEERRATALSYIRGERVIESDVSDEAKVLLAVSLLICNDVGAFTKTQLAEALDDPSVIQAARQLLKEAEG